jgi:mRNA-degrading endonuclease toxin of MazEF toxin-antitoxin module
MPVQRGDIVLAELPFSDGTGSKIRPALVVQCDYNNRRLQDVMVAVITKTVKNATIEATQLLIDITTTEGKASNLLHTSAVKCEHIITIDQALVRKTIGRLSAAMMTRIDACLKAAFQLP